jgi:hypothetical protein
MASRSRRRSQPMRGRDALDSAFLAMSKARVGALLVLGDNMFDVVKERLLDLASRNRLSTMYAAKTYVEAGGLLSYAV